MADVVLYDYWRSSASYRVRIALSLAGIDYDAVSVDLTSGAQKSEQHVARNPQGFVPVLEIDGLRLTQSLAILEYLDETRELGLLPAEAGARAKVRALAQAVAVDVHPVCNLQVAKYAAEIAGRKEATQEWMLHFIRPGMIAFEGLLNAFETSPFCAGELPGLADICLMPQVYNAERWGVEISDLPRIQSVMRSCKDHPAFLAAHPDRWQP